MSTPADNWRTRLVVGLLSLPEKDQFDAIRVLLLDMADTVEQTGLDEALCDLAKRIESGEFDI